MVATTIPGLEPENIPISADGFRLSIQGTLSSLGLEKRSTRVSITQTDGRAA